MTQRLYNLKNLLKFFRLNNFYVSVIYHMYFGSNILDACFVMCPVMYVNMTN